MAGEAQGRVAYFEHQLGPYAVEYGDGLVAPTSADEVFELLESVPVHISDEFDVDDAEAAHNYIRKARAQQCGWYAARSTMIKFVELCKEHGQDEPGLMQPPQQVVRFIPNGREDRNLDVCNFTGAPIAIDKCDFIKRSIEQVLKHPDMSLEIMERLQGIALIRSNRGPQRRSAPTRLPHMLVTPLYVFWPRSPRPGKTAVDTLAFSMGTGYNHYRLEKTPITSVDITYPEPRNNGWFLPEPKQIIV